MTIKREIKENMLYLLLWLLLFIAPIITTYIRSMSGDGDFHWNEVFHAWGVFVVYLAIFLVHNFFLAPQLVYHQRKVVYFLSLMALLVIFSIYQCSNSPSMMGGPPDHEMGMMDGDRPGPPPDIMAMDSLEEAMGPAYEHRPLRGPDGSMGPPDGDGHPPLQIHPPLVFSIVIVLLMIGMNLGVKLYFKSDEDAKEMKELEKRSLEQQLAYLKYQINPHFFMNTLNNIHALVDIDSEKAKETILILSKIMRYVLYEGDKSLIPVQREVDFVNNYIELMKIRYTDKVKINVDVPEHLPEAGIPPLLLITFVENAFKHGVSYKQDSFIDIKVSVDNDRLKFNCRNSKRKEGKEEIKQGGVGLANIKQRLDLLYGKNFTLDLENGKDTYEVLLLLPLKKL